MKKNNFALKALLATLAATEPNTIERVLANKKEENKDKLLFSAEELEKLSELEGREKKQYVKELKAKYLALRKQNG